MPNAAPNSPGWMGSPDGPNPALHPPAEWTPHAAIWTAWPADESLWLDNLEPAQAEVAAMVHALSADGPDGRPGDDVKVLACGPEAMLSAQIAVGAFAEIVPAEYGDIWLRDTGPIFYSVDRAARFRFNGWGGKYVLENDDTVGDLVASMAGAAVAGWDRVLEGGALDWDGEGTILTTRQCLLNPNRNPGFAEADVEKLLADALGARKVLWLGEGLANDHTDGHVDNIARFVAPGVVVCQRPYGADDPNADVLDAIAADLVGMSDAAGRKLRVVRIPSPGRVLGLAEDGEGEGESIVPASHANFLIGNACVVVPTYGGPSGAEAVAELQALFPGRRVIGLSARHILSGGGAFHCITQQQPARMD